MIKRISLTLLILSVFVVGSIAQHENSSAEDHHEHHGPYHKLTPFMAYSLLKNAGEENTNKLLLVPTFGLNYDYFFTPKWGAGLHTDIILQQYKVEDDGDEAVIVRENPVGLCAVGSYKPIESLTIMLGYGVEIEKHDHFQLIRIGVEYGVELPNNWELGFALEYDRKIQTYGSVIFGVGFSKLFRR